MDAVATLLAQRDAATLLYVMAAYLVPFLLYCVTSGLAFLALAERPDATSRTVRRGLLVFAVPIFGALIVMAQLGRAPSSTAR